jgi:hypothetical protein
MECRRGVPSGAKHASPAVLCAILLLLSGCGSSGGGFVSAANTICKRYNAKIAANTPAKQSTLDIARVNQNEALERGAIAELAKLKAPASVSSDWQRILTYRRSLADGLATLARAQAGKDTRTVEAAIASKKREHLELLDVAARHGLIECGQTG